MVQEIYSFITKSLTAIVVDSFKRDLMFALLSNPFIAVDAMAASEIFGISFNSIFYFTQSNFLLTVRLNRVKIVSFEHIEKKSITRELKKNTR